MAVAGLLMWRLPWSELLANLREGMRERAALAPVIEQARRRALSYESVAADFSGADLGAAVLWCIDHPARGVSRVSDDAQKVVAWIDEILVPLNPDAKHGCRWMVGVVRGRRADGVLLEYKGTP